MNKILFSVLIILIFNQVSDAQKLDKKTVDNTLGLFDDAVYVVNGLAYEQKDSLKLNSTLKSYSFNHLVELTKLKNDGNIIRCTNNDVAIIFFATQQAKKEIKKKLDEVRNKFPDEYHGFSQHILADSKNPVLIVDNKTVHHAEAKMVIDNLKTSDIFFVDYKSEPQSIELHGQNAKNGLIRIWTKYLERS